MLREESDDILYRFCVASLHRMIKLREEMLEGKKGRGELSNQRKPIMTKELQILHELLLKDKTNIPASLKTLDEGNLKFPKTELLPFLRSRFTSVLLLADYLVLIELKSGFHKGS